jgi:hypothetical protein
LSQNPRRAPLLALLLAVSSPTRRGRTSGPNADQPETRCRCQ